MEYDVTDCVSDVKVIKAYLNQQAKLGWTLHSITPKPRTVYVIVVLQRPERDMLHVFVDEAAKDVYASQN